MALAGTVTVIVMLLPEPDTEFETTRTKEMSVANITWLFEANGAKPDPGMVSEAPRVEGCGESDVIAGVAKFGITRPENSERVRASPIFTEPLMLKSPTEDGSGGLINPTNV